MLLYNIFKLTLFILFCNYFFVIFLKLINEFGLLINGILCILSSETTPILGITLFTNDYNYNILQNSNGYGY